MNWFMSKEELALTKIDSVTSAIQLTVGKGYLIKITRVRLNFFFFHALCFVVLVKGVPRKIMKFSKLKINNITNVMEISEFGFFFCVR